MTFTVGVLAGGENERLRMVSESTMEAINQLLTRTRESQSSTAIDEPHLQSRAALDLFFVPSDKELAIQVIMVLPPHMPSDQPNVASRQARVDVSVSTEH